MDSTIREVQIAVFLANLFNWNVLDWIFCIELEEYRPSKLGSIIFMSKRTDLRKKLGGTYKRGYFLFLEKRRFG